MKGKAVSRGIAFGQVVCLHGDNRQFFRVSLKAAQIEPEIRRLRSAFKKAAAQLAKLARHDSSKPTFTGQEIFGSQLLLLQDQSLVEKTENYIRQHKVNAEWSVQHIFDEYVIQFKAIDDEHIREKYLDIEDIAERILNALIGNSKKLRIGKNSIVAAKELHPSTLVELNGSYPVGLLSEHGGWTSHAFILARESAIPSVTGLKKVMRLLENGDEIIVDGNLGHIIINPSKDTIASYRAKKESFSEVFSPSEKPSAAELKTLDNTQIFIRANADSVDSFTRAKKFGANGIGLYRSEFLFNRYGNYPTENQQFDEYDRLASAVGKEHANIRTFDISISKLIDKREERESNPALGLRGIRLSLKYPKQFKTQIRAILRASSKGSINIVLPMISGLTDILEVKKIIKKERDDLIKKKTPVGNPQLGIMVEVPSTVLILDNILSEIDFVCLGTNDLSQYLLAADRDNETVSPWLRTLHPAVIKAIKIVIDVCQSLNKQLILCGEMSGSPFYVPILIGLGATELSMNANSMSRVRNVISGIAAEEAKELVDEITKCRTASEIEALTNLTLFKKWSHLYPTKFLNSRSF